MKKLLKNKMALAGLVLLVGGLTTLVVTTWEYTVGNYVNNQEQAAISNDDIFDKPFIIPDTNEYAEQEATMTVQEPELVDASKDVQYGQVFARFYVPRFGKDYVRVIAEGTSANVLANAMGHYRSTDMPWEGGNFAVAAHRTTHGASLMNIDKLVKGDLMVVETAFSYVLYEHVNTVIVSPKGTGILSDMPNKFKGNKGVALLTLTSCYPKYDDAKRIVAFNAYVGSFSKKDYTLEEVLASK